MTKYANVKKVNTIANNNNQSGSKLVRNLIILAISFVLIALISIVMFGNKVKALFDPVSISESITNVEVKETDGRTNILVLGSDKRGVDERSAYLTDTILVASIGRVEKDVLLLSLPRDLWVENSNGGYSKINSVYANAYYSNRNGAESIKQVVENVLGLDIHYYVVIDFELFKDSVDTLGGIDVYVDTPFTDTYYPVEGKEAASFEERYQTVSFSEGLQTMDGETALQFARSRHGNNDEGTDFARSARQQKIILAIKDKALQMDTLLNPTKLKDLYDLYSTHIETNLNFADIQNFYLLSQQIDFNEFESIVLDDRSAAEEGGLLYAPQDTTLYGNQYVLVPKSGDFEQLHAYVQRYLYEDN